jgi:Zn-finger nucleic acid-binding protein
MAGFWVGSQYNSQVLSSVFMEYVMQCPKCSVALVKKYYKGMMEVDYCPNCRGMWLDFAELDRLEDVEFSRDDKKGSLIHRETNTPYPCPQCLVPLQEFQYRLYSLRLDFCAQGRHGFWLDSGEDERVLAIMRQRAADIHRQADAEAEWKGTLKRLHGMFKNLK